MNRLALTVFMLGAAQLGACERDPENMRIIARVTSPDGTRDALYAEDMSGGATLGTRVKIYIVAKGGLPQIEDHVLSQERVCNVTVRWLNNEAVEVSYSGRSDEFEGSNAAGPVRVDVWWRGRDVVNGC